ncbi:hypothetical protein [Paenibacillus amylolyticus]|uniref:hypothetical protein n=1 Tax=Paenibacillus amylolyticus TaxID=1451 RepID=UPI003D99272E
MPRLIDADKLLKWIEESPEAEGFWGYGNQVLEATAAFDNLTEAIETGVFNSDQPREDI